MHNIQVSIVYAIKRKQWQKELRVPRGTSAQELVVLSDMQHEIDDLRGTRLDALRLGVYSIPVEYDYLLEEGDRLEIYRPLTADPKEVRRQLALLGKTMGAKK